MAYSGIYPFGGGNITESYIAMGEWVNNNQDKINSNSDSGSDSGSNSRGSSANSAERWALAKEITDSSVGWISTLVDVFRGNKSQNVDYSYQNYQSSQNTYKWVGIGAAALALVVVLIVILKRK